MLVFGIVSITATKLALLMLGLLLSDAQKHKNMKTI